MKCTSAFVASALACLFSASSLAQNGEDTVVLLPEGAELPDVVTAAIDLPKDADGKYRPSVQAVKSSAKGLATANSAREDGRAFGVQMAAHAADNREINSRGARAGSLPDRVPDHVTPPSLPETPVAPPATPAGPPEIPVTPPLSPPVTPPGRP